ncbi:sulfite oxidase heme-binding subunit YedZ [Undibacterium squillarum]|uniref:Protein-methionine-sulfoxide reductase heme-binding subunit MsrQ n=1 Tax=Undibacterium squillarum TaxID=1131567 RepID=A0ABQ2XYD6_9BURK|nr:protein-methionine-sulfoxide reductase heme-binding subunit MsrQ [Undibacterium squillarum]GGX42515.1 protein-methionine-sulfoxide reductase heme-binding subunit MsrQ [Undibacterium squillarum]
MRSLNLSAAAVSRWKIAVFLLALLPLIRIIVWAVLDKMGANPLEWMTRNTGSWAIYILLLTLAITPLRRISGWNWLQKFRRMLGLFAFFYASLHLTMYIWFDHFFEWETIWPDIIKRPFVLAGMVSWGMMLALAISSPQAVLRWMGGKRWQRLHQLMYVLVPVAVLHVYWMKAGKHDFFWPAVYGGITVVLLGLRIWFARRSARAV